MPCGGPLQESIRGVRDLFRDASQTEFIIATIPTQLGIAESKRLLAALQEETIPCKRVIVNQVGMHYATHVCLRGEG
jgi:arsenite-transporting ATPase